MANYDFIGFSFNGKHSIKDFGVYRTSDGSRYNDNLIPQLNDKAADIVGGNGQYFFGSTHKTRQFSIPIAFDSLTETKYREMRRWLDGKEIHDLVFDEVPYKVYSAKVSGTPQLKTICFDEQGERIYKGEGTIQFTCYHPYAHTPNFENKNFTQQTKPLSKNTTVPCGIYVNAGEYVINNFGASLKLCCININTKKIENINIMWSQKPGDIKQFTEDVFIDKITLNTDQDSNNIGQIKVGTIKSGETTSQGNVKIDSVVNYIYCNYNYFIPWWIHDANSLYTPIQKSFYNIGFYPHSFGSSKLDWMFTSGLLKHTKDGDNYGDIPAPFIVNCQLIGTSVDSTTTWTVGNLTVVIKGQWYDVQWDSKTGLITGKLKKEDEEKNRVAIPYIGTSYGALPVSDNTVNIVNISENATLTYNYWYY